LGLGLDLFVICVSDGNVMAVVVSLLELVLTAMLALILISVWGVTLPVHGLIGKHQL
jgi:hypothetical protein